MKTWCRCDCCGGCGRLWVEAVWTLCWLCWGVGGFWMVGPDETTAGDQ